MLSEELVTLEITDNDGLTAEYTVLATFSARSRPYIALSPAQNPETIELYRFNGDLDGEFKLDIIYSDMEFSEANAEFEKLRSEIDSNESVDGVYDLPAVTLTDGMGREYLCNIIKVFDYNESSYIALMPQNQEAENPTIELFAYSTDEDNDIATIEIIPQNIFNDVQKHFLTIANEE